MSSLLDVNRRTLLVACCLVCLLSAVALALNVQTPDRGLQNQKGDAEALKQLESSPEQPLTILGNDDCPLRLVEANVREIPGLLFTELTGRTTSRAAVSSVPEAKMVNASEKTVTGFVFYVRDPKSQTSRLVYQTKIALKPGETHQVKRDHFVAPESMTVTGENGQTRQALVKPPVSSEKYWLDFAPRSDLFVRVGMIEFEDGSSWKIGQGGAVR